MDIFCVFPPDNLRAHPWSYECASAACPGFDVLQSLLVKHFQLPQVYEALAALLLGRRVTHSAEIEVRILGLKWDRLQHTRDTSEDKPFGWMICKQRIIVEEWLVCPAHRKLKIN